MSARSCDSEAMSCSSSRFAVRSLPRHSVRTSRSRSTSCPIAAPRRRAPATARRRRRRPDRAPAARPAAATGPRYSPPPRAPRARSASTARTTSRMRTIRRMQPEHRSVRRSADVLRRRRRDVRVRAAQAVERLLGAPRFRRCRAPSSITCCHALAAPSRSCLPNARTMPTFSSVFECFGSIASERSNCASARSGWFM